ncbi:MAG: SRPBCC family protein [Chloroflexota bacterium]|nr:MAG: SRPBCC family protein [Chloroflexota bacterium]
MILVETETIMPYPIEDVFALTVDLQKAPRWHNVLTDIRQLTANPIGAGSRWKIGYGVGSFELEIVDYQPPNKVVFKGSALFMGTVPNFTVELETMPEGQGTRLRYIAHPHIPRLWRPLMSVLGPAWGRRDLARYFREFETMLALQREQVRR